MRDRSVRGIENVSIDMVSNAIVEQRAAVIA